MDGCDWMLDVVGCCFWIHSNLQGSFPQGVVRTEMPWGLQRCLQWVGRHLDCLQGTGQVAKQTIIGTVGDGCISKNGEGIKQKSLRSGQIFKAITRITDPEKQDIIGVDSTPMCFPYFVQFFSCWLHTFWSSNPSTLPTGFTSQLFSRSVGVITYEALYGYRPFNDAGCLGGQPLLDGVVKDVVVSGERYRTCFVENPVCYHFL